MPSNIEIRPIQPDEYYDLSMMVGELLHEIMERINNKAFNFDRKETQQRANDLISNGKYWVFVARDTKSNNTIGFVSLYET